MDNFRSIMSARNYKLIGMSETMTRGRVNRDDIYYFPRFYIFVLKSLKCNVRTNIPEFSLLLF